MIYDMRNGLPMPTCWDPSILTALQALTNLEYHDAAQWIHLHIFDMAVHRGRMNVTHAVRQFISPYGDWTGSPLEPLWAKTQRGRGQADEEYAGLLYGNFVCELGIHRPETFLRLKEPVKRDHPESSTYVHDASNWIATAPQGLF